MGHRLPSLTGLRFAAAMLVFGVHAYSFLPLAQGPARDAARLLFDAGDLGVSFFFVLSGFVLAWSARPGQSLGRFWRHRLARIYPAHLAALAFAVGCLAVSDRITKVTTETTVTGLLLIQSWFPQDWLYLGINSVTWSLSCELAFYAGFPALYAALRRLGSWGPGAWALRAGAAGLCAAVWLVPVVAELAVPADHRRWFVYIFPLTRMLEFALGIALALLVRSGGWRGPGLPAAMALFAVNYALIDELPAAGRDTAATIVAIALLIPAAALADLRGAPSPWRHPAVVRLGEMSYSFYLVHLVTLVAVVTLIGRDAPWRPLPAALVAAAVLVLAYAIAAALFRWVEMPTLRLLTRRSDRGGTTGLTGGTGDTAGARAGGAVPLSRGSHRAGEPRAAVRH
ncbi:MAG TPA: acyltransferase [Pilimelia sp.]|nr:acyltransferase [Pilimelia sp.]